MPELPEVETVVRALRKPLIGRTVTGVYVTWSNSIKTPIKELKNSLPGERIVAIERRGKYLNFKLASGRVLILHLKMSGDLLVESSKHQRHPHVRTAFSLDNGTELRFKDTRKFGRVYLVSDPAQVTGKLGPEPLSEQFTFEVFQGLCARRKGRLKSLFLNQEFIAGLGNIYVDEVCFRAGVHPLKRVDRISRAKLLELYRAIRFILNQAIKHHGSTFDYVYRGGNYQNRLKVYGRGGQSCSRCAKKIRRVIVGARSTHYCPGCQK